MGLFAFDGCEATKAIRGIDHPEVKTIQIIEQSAGMKAHVAKPIKPELLAKALENAFKANNKAE